MLENKAKSLRESTRDEVELRLHDLEEELRNLRFRASMKQEGNPLRMREIRHDIARVKTVLREDALGIRRLASDEIDAK